MSAQKFAAFDLEVAKGFPDNAPWQQSAPLGIACAAIAFSDRDEPRFFRGVPQMKRDECVGLVRELERLAAEGYTLVTWNGTAFDWAVLAQEADMPAECAALALAHCDLMVIVTFRRGHFLGLQRALDGAELAGKLKAVTLNDGTRLTEMSGKLAPQLWAQGEYNAVLSYLREDVVPLIELLRVIEVKRTLRWVSQRGKPCSVPISRFWSVRECFEFPLPDTGWMQTPPAERAKFVEWMPPLEDVIPRAPYTTHELRELPLFAYAAENPYWREFRHALRVAQA